jgi:D-amino-acid dehydrogenase
VKSQKQEFDVVILGAGVVGINTAYFALRHGKSVCVVDRRARPGLETSFANGGQVSVSHAEPWANPSAPLKVLKWLFDSEAPLLFRPRIDIRQWLWIAQFVVDCLPHRADRHTTEIVKLATESRALMREIRSREQLQYDLHTNGILHFYRDAREFESAVKVAELMRRHGCDRRVLDVQEILRIEPAFAERERDIVGGTFTADDESGDAFKYTQGLAAICERMGARFRYESEAVALYTDRKNRQVQGVELQSPEGYRTLRARDFVVSMGSSSAPFLRRYGVGLNIYPAKGYSVTIPVAQSNSAPVTSLTDDEYKLVYSNYGDRLRVAGTAELSGYSNWLDLGRCNAILKNVKNLFPRAGNFEAASFWTGLRPSTPSNLPYVGRSSYRNLWLNTGHGTLGWTLGAGSGFRIADMIAANDGPVVA